MLNHRVTIALSTAMLILLISISQLSAQVTREDMLEAFRRENSENAAIEKMMSDALDKKITLEMANEPFGILAQELTEQLGIEVELDLNSLHVANMHNARRISLNLNDAPAGEGLKSFLGEHKLAFVVVDESLIITSAKAIQSDSVEMSFDVSHLVHRNLGVDVGDVRLGNNTRQRAEQTLAQLKAMDDSLNWGVLDGTTRLRVVDRHHVTLAVAGAKDTLVRLKKVLGDLTSQVERASASSSNSGDQRSRRVISDDAIVTFVYPINQELVKTEEAIDLIETVIGKDILQLEKGPFLLKRIGNTVVVKHYKSLHDRVYQLLNESGALMQDDTNRQAAQQAFGGGLGGEGFGGGGFGGGSGGMF